MKALKTVTFDPEKNVFAYSFEPGAEILGIKPRKSGPGVEIIVLMDPNEPATEKHKFMCVTLEQGCTRLEHVEVPEADTFYLGTVGDFHYFEVLE